MPWRLHNIYGMKKDFTEKQVQNWILDHGYKVKKKDLKQHEPTEWRYNQVPKQKFTKFRTQILPNGIHFIWGFQPEKK